MHSTVDRFARFERTLLVAIASSLMLPACVQPEPETPTSTKHWTEGELECIAQEKARVALVLTSCGENEEGQCSLETIYDKSKKVRKQCLKDY